MQYELPGCQVRSNCRSGGHSIHGEPCSPRNNDIPIVRYWAQAPDGSPTEHCIAAALDLLRACRRAFQCQAGKGPWAAGGCRRGMGISRECHRSRTPASAASASHDLWDCREGTRSPATATSPCGQPALASADRRTSHDGIVRAASTRLPGCQAAQAARLYPWHVSHVHVPSHSQGPLPRGSSSKMRGMSHSVPWSVLVFFSPHFCHAASARLARARSRCTSAALQLRARALGVVVSGSKLPLWLAKTR